MRGAEHSKSDQAGSGPGAWLLGLLVVTATVITLLGVYKVWYHYQTVGLGYELASETIRHRKLYGQNRRLSIELESMKREGMLRLRGSAPERWRRPAPEDRILVEP